MKRAAIAVVLVAAAIGVGLFVTRRAPAPAALDARATGAAPDAAAIATPPGDPPIAPARPVAPALPAAASPVASATPAAASPSELQRRLALAQSGDPAAMRQIGTDLRGCSGARIDLERSMVDAMVKSDRDRPASAPPDTPERTAMRRASLERARGRIAECETIAPADREQWFAWTEKAATAGDIGARRDFFDYALDDFADVDQVGANIDEIERRRDLARQFQREATAACMPAAYIMPPRLFEVLGMTDLRERLALLHAAVLLPSSEEGSPARLRFEIESRNADPALIDEAEQLGAAGVAHCPRGR